MASQDSNPSSKTIVVEVTNWLKLYSDGTVERTGPPQAGPLLTPVPPYTEARNGVTVHDFTATDPPVRIYLPDDQTADNDHHKPGKGESRRLPIFLHFHGGAFCLSHPAWALYHDFYAKLPGELRAAAVVSPVLPLAPERRLPAAIDAAFSALLWLRSVAIGDQSESLTLNPAIQQLYKTGDFSRVFLIGDSSGGNLVHEVCARAGAVGSGLLHPLRVAGGILLHPGFAGEKRSRSELENPQGPFMNLEMIDKLLLLAVPAGSGGTKDHPYVNPVGDQAPPVEGLKMPPLLVAVAERDLLRDRQVEYFEAVRNVCGGNNKDVRLVVSAGMEHVFYLNKFAVEGDPVTGERARELVREIKKFVDEN